MDSDTLKMIANFAAKKIAILAAGALVTLGVLHTGNDQTQFIELGSSIIVGLIGVLWSWWNDRGKQLVLATLAKAHRVAPMSASTAAASKAMSESVNDNKLLPMSGGAVKIVSALLIGFLVLQAMPAKAQTTAAPAVPAAVTQAVTQAITFLDGLINAGQQFVTTDLNLAIADANAQTPPNTQAAACWTAIKALNFSAVPAGAGVAYIKQRLLDVEGQYASINSNCSYAAPLFVKAYNQFIQQVNQLGV